MEIAEFKRKWFNDRLEDLKKYRSTSATVVAGALGKHKQQISHWRKKSAPPDDVLQRFCDLYKFRFPIDMSMEEGPPKSSANDAGSNDLAEVVDRIRRLENRSKVVNDVLDEMQQQLSAIAKILGVTSEGDRE